MPLTTRCNHCGRLFPVYAQQLRARRGKTACPQCGKRCDAVRGLIDEAMPGQTVPDPSRSGAGPRRPAATAPAALMTYGEPPRRRENRVLWGTGAALLLLTLAAQALWWERGTWLLEPGVKSALERVCAEPHCGLPLPRLAGTVEILDPAMNEHPQDPAVLRLHLTLINRASVLQRLPLLDVELYDHEGGLTAHRRLVPALYQPNNPAAGIAPGAALNLMLDIAAPPTPPSGFRLKLY
jgi:hypothetical protein